MKDIEVRRQRRMDKAKVEQELVSMWRKKMRLLNAKRGMTLVELEKPVRSGYKRFFVLREDVAKSREAHVYRQLLPYVQHVQHCRDKKFLYKDYKTKKMLPMQHHPKAISHKDWNKLIEAGTLTIKQKAMFVQVWKQTNPKNPKVGHYEFVFQKDWVFAEHIEPHYKTHTLLIDPQLESELQEINNKIERNNLQSKIGKKLGWNQSYGGWNDRKRSIIEKYYANQTQNILEYKDDNDSRE